jgi:hypothetical protein
MVYADDLCERAGFRESEILIFLCPHLSGLFEDFARLFCANFLTIFCKLFSVLQLC